MAHRSDFSKPYACIAGLDTPSIAVRACPSLFRMIDHKEEVETLTEGRHRSIFAILTTDTVYIHDTQHPNPLMKISNIHHATLNDCSRSEEHTSELQSLMRISYDVFCLKKKNNEKTKTIKQKKQ